MSFRFAARSALISTLLALCACGGASTLPEASSDPSASDPGRAPASSDPSAPTSPIPPPRFGPYDGVVGTTDVSILYPLTAGGGASEFVAPTEIGRHGVLFPQALFDQILQGRQLERTTAAYPSGYSALRVVSLRLDPCSARTGGGGGGCRSEVRLVLQALYDKAAGAEDDPSSGTAAADGGVHVIYDVPDAELVTMMKEILTLKKESGGLALHELAPHPILAAQGLSGAFATGLRQILLYHLGEARIGRVTFFDHNNDPDSDGWTFGVFDRIGATFSLQKIPTTGHDSIMIIGSSALAPLAESSAATFEDVVPPESVAPLVSGARPEPGSPQASLLSRAFEAALRVQNPTVHTAESTDCGNCHLAEGARRIGESVYGFTSASGFKHTRSLARRDERSSVTNLHAFGYLHRKVAIMQRTANESVLVAEQMEAKVK